MLVFPALCCTAGHFYYLASAAAGTERAAAILDETATSYVTRVAYCMAVVEPSADLATKLVPIGIMVYSMMATSGLRLVQSLDVALSADT